MVERLTEVGAEITRRLSKARKEIAERRIAARDEIVEKFTKIRHEIAGWIERRRLPDDPAALVRLHWPSIEAESAPFELLRNRLRLTESDGYQGVDTAAAADRDLQRVDAALRHTAHEQQNLDRIEAWALGCGVLLGLVGAGVILAAVNAWLEPGLQGGEWHGVLAAAGLCYTILWTALGASKLSKGPGTAPSRCSLW